MSKRAGLESRLKELHDSIVVNQIEAGRILAELRETFKHGEWMPYYRKLVERLGISLKTADRYREAFEQSEKWPKHLVKKAMEAGLNLNRKPVREKLAEVNATNLGASSERIVNLTKMELESRRSPEAKVDSKLSAEETQVFNIYNAIERAQQDVPKNHKKERIEEALAYVAQYVLGGESLSPIEPKTTEGNWILTGRKRGAA